MRNAMQRLTEAILDAFYSACDDSADWWCMAEQIVADRRGLGVNQ